MLNPVTAAEKPRKRKKWDVADPQGESLQADPKKPSAFLRPNPQFSVRPMAQVSPLGIQATAQAPGVRAPLPDAAVPEASAMSAVEIAERAKRGALSVLNKINQDLKAKGALPPHIMHLVEESVSRQVVINDAPPAIRFNLTRRAVQDDIGRRTGTSVVVRGQYYSPGQVHGEEKPLHLKITPGVVLSQSEEVQQKAVDLAAQEIEHILSGGQPGSFVPPRSDAMGANPAYPSHGSQWPQGHGLQRPASAQQPGHYPPQRAPGQSAEGWPGQASGGYQSQMYAQYSGLSNPQARPQSNHAFPPPAYQAAPPPDVPLYIGLEAPPEYNLPGRLHGPDGTYLRHISDQTGSQLTVRGQISGRQEGQVPLHILVSGGTQAGHSEAVRLAKNLIDSVRVEHNRAFPNGYQPIRVSNSAAGQWNNAHSVHQSASYSHPSMAFSHPGMAPHVGSHGGFNPGQAPPQYAGSALPVHNAPALQYPPTAYGSYQPTAQAPSDFQGRPAYGGAYSQAPAASPMPQQTNYYQQSQEAAQAPSVHQQTETLDEGFGGSRAAPEDSSKPALPEPQEEAPKRRRFKEVKDRPPPVPESPAPYAPTVMGPPAPRKPGSMAPPPPRGPTSMGPPPSRPAPGPMGPPPPRLASSMGPPPPRLAPQQAAKPTGDQQEEDLVSGSLAGFLDY